MSVVYYDCLAERVGSREKREREREKYRERAREIGREEDERREINAERDRDTGQDKIARQLLIDLVQNSKLPLLCSKQRIHIL